MFAIPWPSSVVPNEKPGKEQRSIGTGKLKQYKKKKRVQSGTLPACFPLAVAENENATSRCCIIVGFSDFRLFRRFSRLYVNVACVGHKMALMCLAFSYRNKRQTIKLFADFWLKRKSQLAWSFVFLRVDVCNYHKS